MSEAFLTGWQHATWAAGWAFGAGLYVALLALVYLAVDKATGAIAAWARHRWTVHRVRRDHRRYARTPGRQHDPYAANRNPDGSYSFPIVD